MNHDVAIMATSAWRVCQSSNLASPVALGVNANENGMAVGNSPNDGGAGTVGRVRVAMIVVGYGVGVDSAGIVFSGGMVDVA